MKNVRTPQGGIFFDSHCTWVVLKNSSRPTLRDQGQDQQCQDVTSKHTILPRHNFLTT